MPEPAQSAAAAPSRVVVAIDGPSGSGKSTVSRQVAAALGLGYLDTGAMYRALTWWCLEQGIALDDEDAVLGAATALPLHMGTDPAAPRVLVGAVDVAEQIREPRISRAVSTVAANLRVRERMRDLQRALMAEPPGGVVAEGRDITTVVAPDADVRILLTADQDARLARRATELHGRADEQALEATRDQIVRRDRADSAVSSFLTAADGVLTIDSSSLTLGEVVEAVLAQVRARTGRVPVQVH